MSLSAPLLLTPLVLLLSGASSTTGRVAAFLDDPARDSWQRPAEVVRALELEAGDSVVDLGAGSGYFTLRLAAAVGPKGRVLALDTDRALLARAATKARNAKAYQVHGRYVAADDPKIDRATVDRILLCNVYHQIRERPRYFHRLSASLRGGGRVAIVDWKAGATLPDAPAAVQRVPRAQLLREMAEAGYEHVGDGPELEHQYMALFRPRSPRSVDELAARVRAAREAFYPAETELFLDLAASALARFLADGALPEGVDRPLPGLPITTYMMHVEPEGAFSIAALLLQPGASTPVHDHGTWTVWGTRLGADSERQFTRDDADPSAGEFPDLKPVAERELGPGDVSVLPPPRADVHVVRNVGEGPSLSVHIHGADMSRQARHTYDLEKRFVMPFVQSYEEDREKQR